MLLKFQQVVQTLPSRDQMNVLPTSPIQKLTQGEQTKLIYKKILKLTNRCF